MADALYYLNLVIAALASFAAFGMLNKQRWGATRPCIIGATLLIALGFAGQWLGLMREEWVIYSDTALYGGILALLIADQHRHSWFLERWANPVASGVALAVGLVFLAGLLGGCAAAPAEEEVWVRVCAERHMGRDESGNHIVMHACVRPQ